jgi:hypothetical protein
MKKETKKTKRLTRNELTKMVKVVIEGEKKKKENCTPGNPNHRPAGEAGGGRFTDKKDAGSWSLRQKSGADCKSGVVQMPGERFTKTDCGREGDWLCSDPKMKRWLNEEDDEGKSQLFYLIRDAVLEALDELGYEPPVLDEERDELSARRYVGTGIQQKKGSVKRKESDRERLNRTFAGYGEMEKLGRGSLRERQSQKRICYTKQELSQFRAQIRTELLNLIAAIERATKGKDPLGRDQEK